MRRSGIDGLGTLVPSVARLGFSLAIFGSVLHGAARPALGAETLFAAFTTCRGVPTTGRYYDVIDVTFDGWGTIGANSRAFDAFYSLSPTDPSVSLGPNEGAFRFSGAVQGGCICQASCSATSQSVSDALIGPIPPFNPEHHYRVELNVGIGGPDGETLTFGAGDCACAADTGGITVATVGCSSDSDCDDGNLCTVDFCAGDHCAHYVNPPPPEGYCDDGDPCTANDHCDLSGMCTGNRVCFPGGQRLRPTHPVRLLAGFGGAVAATGDIVVIGAGLDATGGGAYGAAYVYAASTGVLLYRLSNPDPPPAVPGAGTTFGSAVAAEHDVLLVGAPANQGKAWVFDLSAGTLLAPLVNPAPSPPGAADFFGTAVALAGSKAIVSAPFQDGRGAVYVFDAASGGLLYPPLVRPDNSAPYGFGSSLAVFDDRILVGDPNAVQHGGATGAVHEFDLATGTYIETWRNPDPGPGFGSALAVSGTDVLVGTIGMLGIVNVIDTATGNVKKFPDPTPPLQVFGTAPVFDLYGNSMAVADGRLAVGAPHAPAGGDGGKVHLFDLATGALIRTIVDPLPNDPALLFLGHFGQVMAALATPSILIGAPDDADVRGTVYVLDASSGGIVGGFQPPRGSSLFGQAIAGNGSGVFVGAPGDYDLHPAKGGKAGGKVYAYGVDGVAAAAIVDPTHEDEDRFGAAIAADAVHLAIGAPGTAGGSGEAFVFRPTGSLPLVASFVAPDGADGDGLGSSIGLASGTVLAGAPYADGEAEDEGRVYELDADTGKLLHILTAPEPSEGAYFGAAVAGSGDSALVGAPFDDAGRGRVYLADVPSGAVVRSFAYPGTGSRSLFGSSVAWVGSQVLVGAPLEDAGDNGTLLVEAGAAYLFDPTTRALVQTFRAMARNAAGIPVAAPQRGAQFGFSVAAIDGDVLVGSPLFDSDPTTIDTGGVYRFHATGEFVGRYESLTPGSREQFGFALGSLGTSVLAGAPGSRSAYILTGPPSGASGISGAASVRATAAPTAGGKGPACLGGYCYDGNPCTTDRCDVAEGGCVFDPIPGCGCRTDFECSDDATCNGKYCLTCDGCFLHRWACCGRQPHCASGRRAANGTPCDDGGRCPRGGECRSGACMCEVVLTPTTTTTSTTVPNPPECFGCHDDDPCTNDLCDAAAGCRFEPVTGEPAITCAFERAFPGSACAGQRVPKMFKQDFGRAHRAVVAAQSGPEKRRRARLKTADRIVNVALDAVHRVPRRRRRPIISSGCADNMAQLLGDAKKRIDAALGR